MRLYFSFSFFLEHVGDVEVGVRFTALATSSRCCGMNGCDGLTRHFVSKQC